MLYTRIDDLLEEGDSRELTREVHGCTFWALRLGIRIGFRCRVFDIETEDLVSFTRMELLQTLWMHT